MMRILVPNDGGIGALRFVLDGATIQIGEAIEPPHLALTHDRALTALDSLYR